MTKLNRRNEIADLDEKKAGTGDDFSKFIFEFLAFIARSSAYYPPVPVSDADLALIRRIDELHL